MFWIRLRSSIILMVITLAAVLLGGNLLFAAVLAISLIGMMELYRTVKLNKTGLAVLGYMACIVFYLLVYIRQEQYYMPLFLGFLLLLMFVHVLTFPKYQSDQITLVFYGLFYVAVMLSYIYKVRMLKDGDLLVWLIFIGAWGSDTCAYCVGILLGKRKAFPKLSPKKSLEGCIGGILGAALLGYIYGAVFHFRIFGVREPALSFAVICGISSVISQLGDLAASAIKRNHGIKDYGKLLPGHGGVLDRFDSIIFVAPIVYFLVDFM